MITLIYIFSITFVILFLGVAVFSLVSRNKIRKKIVSDSITHSYELPVALAGSEDACHINFKKVPVNAIDITQYTDAHGVILNPRNFEKYVVTGSPMRFTGINNNDLIFVTKSFSTNLEDFPAVMLIHKDENSPHCPDWKIRRVWAVADFEDDLVQVVRKLLDSEKFKQLKSLPAYPGDALLLEDFIENRMPKYAEKYITCKNPKLGNRRIVISSTYDTSNRVIHLSIHALHQMAGKVVASFPLTAEQLKNMEIKLGVE